ncbi:hypothetical protein MRB53_039390 [Persea americana]|nr:hypothetical protein MRB53_039390 [Persea americana]
MLIRLSFAASMILSYPTSVRNLTSLLGDRLTSFTQASSRRASIVSREQSSSSLSAKPVHNCSVHCISYIHKSFNLTNAAQNALPQRHPNILCRPPGPSRQLPRLGNPSRTPSKTRPRAWTRPSLVPPSRALRRAHATGIMLMLQTEQAVDSAKSAANVSSGEAKGKAEELKGQASGKASELAGEAKGKINEVKGKM